MARPAKPPALPGLDGKSTKFRLLPEKVRQAREREELYSRLMDNPDFVLWITQVVDPQLESLKTQLLDPEIRGVQNDLIKALIAIVGTLTSANFDRFHDLARRRLQMLERK